MEGLPLTAIFTYEQHPPCQKAGWQSQSAMCWAATAQQPEEPREGQHDLTQCDAAMMLRASALMSAVRSSQDCSFLLCLARRRKGTACNHQAQPAAHFVNRQWL